MLDAGQREQLKKQLNDLLYKMIAEDRRVEISTTSDLGACPDNMHFLLARGERVRFCLVS